jgi:hypothetical protein
MEPYGVPLHWQEMNARFPTQTETLYEEPLIYALIKALGMGAEEVGGSNLFTRGRTSGMGAGARELTDFLKRNVYDAPRREPTLLPPEPEPLPGPPMVSSHDDFVQMVMSQMLGGR